LALSLGLLSACAGMPEKAVEGRAAKNGAASSPVDPPTAPLRARNQTIHLRWQQLKDFNSLLGAQRSNRTRLLLTDARGACLLTRRDTSVGTPFAGPCRSSPAIPNTYPLVEGGDATQPIQSIHGELEIVIEREVSTSGAIRVTLKADLCRAETDRVAGNQYSADCKQLWRVAKPIPSD